jgi:hypothetical protein
MKFSVLMISVLGVFMSCNPAADNSAANVAVVDKYIQAVEAEDYEVMASLLDENYLGMGPSFGDSINREDALASWKENVANLYDKIEYRRSQTAPIYINEGPNKGEWVSNFAELKITYKGDKGSVIIWANTNYKVANGKITASLTFYNEADALRQLGYVFINPNEL